MNQFSTASYLTKAPPLSLLAMEPLRAVLDMLAAKLANPARLVGDGHPVIVFPGLGGASFTTSHLRKFLDDSGFASHCWGRGVNRGPDGRFDRWLAGLEEDVRWHHEKAGRKVSLVGWSLGGIYAREIAKRCPESVRQVITLGTPFAGIQGATHAEAVYKLFNGDAGRLTAATQGRLRAPPPVPTTSIYSKSDGVVSWQSCIEKSSAETESIEITASHLGMGSHPEAMRIIADRLSQPEGQWRPFRSA